MDFDVVDPPVFARKSAPPAPIDGCFSDDRDLDGTNPASESSPDVSRKQDENSSAGANGGQLRAASPLPRSAESQEPMEQDIPQTPPEAVSATKKVRKRNRNKKSSSKDSGPDIPSMLAGLRPDEAVASTTISGPPLPLLPPPPPPPPPPPAATRAAKGKQVPPRAGEVETEKSKAATGKKTPGPGKNSGGAQRTLGRIPRIDNSGKPVIESHNRQWLADSKDAPSQGAAAEPSSGPSLQLARPTTMQGGRQNTTKQNNSICLDISSYRFLPEDDRRVAIVLRKMRGDPEHQSVDLTSSNKQILHDLPTVSSEEITGVPLAEAPGADSLCGAEGDRYVSVPDFASTEIPWLRDGTHSRS